MLNDNLVETANALFVKTFIQSEDTTYWPTGHFEDLIIDTIGGDWGQETPTGNYTEKVSCIRGTDIPSLNLGSISDAPTRYILPKNLANKRVRANNMIVEISGGSPTQATGRIAMVPEQVLAYRSKNLICSNFCRVLNVKDEYVFYFLQYWLYLYRNGRMFDYENSSTGLKNFNFAAFTETIEISLPPLDLLQRFNVCMESIYNEIFNAGFEIESLKALQAHVLPQIMLHGI